MKAIPCLFGLCLLAGAINADFAWEQGKQYKYKVSGRAMAGFSGISGVGSQFAELQMEYYQIITVKQPRVLNVKTEDLKVFDTNGGWRDGQIEKGEEAQIPAEWKQFIASPMELILKKGVVDSIRVEGDLPTWAVNMKRAMASTFNLNLIGQTQNLRGNLNRPSEEKNQEPSFFYIVLEQSIHGECPVYYTISQSGAFDYPYQFGAYTKAGSSSSEEQEESESSEEPAWLRAFRQHCQQDDQVYEILKTVNLTACAEKADLAYKSPAGRNVKPADNTTGSPASRALVSRYFACGQSRQSYTILKSTQQEQVQLGLIQTEKGVAGAQKNVTLISVHQGQGQDAPLRNPKTIHSLVYQYDPGQQKAVKSGKLRYAQAGHESESDENEAGAQQSAQRQQRMFISPLKREDLKSRIPTLTQEIPQGLTKATEKDSPSPIPTDKSVANLTFDILNNLYHFYSFVFLG